MARTAGGRSRPAAASGRAGFGGGGQVGRKLAAAWGGQPAPAHSTHDREIALLWLGAAVRAWEAVLECHPADSLAYQAGWQQRERFRQALLALLRQSS